MSLKNFVLIETLWNVKLITFVPDPEPNTVLIETLWNVKFCNILMASTSSGY